MIALYALAFGAVSILKYRHYLYTDFDLALFAQAADRLLHGSTWNSVRGMDWRGDHSSFLLYLIAPLVSPFPRAVALLMLQTLVLALGAVPVHRLARRALQDEPLALVCAALYLLHPAVGYTNLFEFHPETLCTTTLLFALEALWEGRTRRMLLFAALSLLGKEDMALPVLGLAACAVTIPRPRRGSPALALVGMAAISLAITFLWLKPTLAHGEIEAARMYGVTGATPGAVLADLFRHPVRTLTSLWSSPGDPHDALVKREYYLQMLLPLGFLPLLAPAVLLLGALPAVAQHFISTRVQQHAIVHQYTAAVTPFLLAAAVLGLARLRRRAGGPTLARVAGWIALGGSVISNLMFGPLVGHRVLQAYPPSERTWPNDTDLTLEPYRDRMVRRVPSGTGVVASFEFLGRLASRADLHSFHHVYLGHYMLSDKPYPVPGGIGALLSTFGDQYDTGAAGRLRELITRNDLHAADAAGDLVLYLRSGRDTLELLGAADASPQAPAHVTYDGQLEFLGCDLPSPRAARGEVITLRSYWRRTEAADRVFLMSLILIDGDGRERFRHTRYLGYGLTTADQWPRDAAMCETYRLIVPRSLPPAPYRLVMQVGQRHGETSAPARPDDPQLAAAGGMIQLGVIDVR